MNSIICERHQRNRKDALIENDTKQNRVGWRFDNTYSRLPEVLFDAATPAAVPSPGLVILNRPLAAELGLDFDTVSSKAAANLLAGQEIPPGCLPLAQAYAGHQFGSFTMLGDGRAILLGEHRTPRGQLVDIHLKGAGQTRFSRRGDGRAAIGPMLREYIVSEAMAALGVPTTRSLAVVTTGEPVYRLKPLPGAILNRVASSHLRVGTFEYLAARQDVSNLRVLADYAIKRHYEELVDAPQKYWEFLRTVTDRQASLVAQWQLVGFIHGVMNTDNVAISGETIDYGPCAFMNAYHTDTVFSSIDHGGRYAYGNQPIIAQWNLARFAETLLPILDPDQQKAVAIASEVLEQYPAVFQQYWLKGMRKKLGLQSEEDGDLALVESLLDWMQKSGTDFTNTFRDLAADQLPATDPYRDPDFLAWHSRWRLRLDHENRSDASIRELMRSVNPAVIPRNHRVEEAISAAEDQDDLSVLHRLLAVLASPYELTADSAPYQEPPPDDCNYQTFCGT